MNLEAQLKIVYVCVCAHVFCATPREENERKSGRKRGDREEGRDRWERGSYWKIDVIQE